ncbi:MAG TPA: serine/threonine-protein kinase [Polyangiaceae bacterium]|nr:serine/threonine-protein kinase [Polyangiaceae bacterium]
MSAVCPRCGLTAPEGALGLCPRCLVGEEHEEPGLPELSGLTVECEIGRGGMGRVYRARHQRLDRTVAVKLLPPELSSEPEFEARFAREARALARLSHPNLLQVHDFGTASDGASYLVMEFAAGGPLSTRIPLPAPEAVHVAIQLCKGLAQVHEHGIVHRDLKPENVLFDAAGTAKLADFGIARLLRDSATAPITESVRVLGTPGYIAPEAARGDAPAPPADIFALGVLLHQMLSGRLPKPGESAIAAPLSALVNRAIALEPSERFESAAEFEAALAAALPLVSATRIPSSPSAWLPPEELSWQRAVALILAGATALSIFAFLVSVTPRVLEPGDALPFIAFGVERLADGRLSTAARFETAPTLAAALGWAVAFGTYGLLRRHWRHAGVELPAPESALRSPRAVMVIALVIDAVFVLRLWIEQTRARALASYIPVLGGVLELGMLYLVWMVVLDAQRSHRSLRREPWLWVGLALSLFPPIFSVFRAFSGQVP